MKLHITPIEAEEGHKRGRFGKKWDDLKLQASNRTPIALTKPVRLNDRECWIVRPRECKEDATGQHISFDTIWARAFRVCHLRSTKVKSVLLETDKEQVMIDENGTYPCKYTTAGPGVDPAVLDRSGKVLADIISEPTYSHIQRHVREYLAKL